MASGDLRVVDNLSPKPSAEGGGAATGGGGSLLPPRPKIADELNGLLALIGYLTEWNRGFRFPAHVEHSMYDARGKVSKAYDAIARGVEHHDILPGLQALGEWMTRPKGTPKPDTVLWLEGQLREIQHSYEQAVLAWADATLPEKILTELELKEKVFKAVKAEIKRIAETIRDRDARVAAYSQVPNLQTLPSWISEIVHAESKCDSRLTRMDVVWDARAMAEAVSKKLGVPYN